MSIRTESICNLSQHKFSFYIRFCLAFYVSATNIQFEKRRKKFLPTPSDKGETALYKYHIKTFERNLIIIEKRKINIIIYK